MRYSFSLVNMIGLCDSWDWRVFCQILERSKTTQIELVPSFCLGLDWDASINDNNSSTCKMIKQIHDHCTTTSIQSLTYGLKINLFDSLMYEPSLTTRISGLAKLGTLLNCKNYVLGSPGQKRLGPSVSPSLARANFVSNCSYIAKTLGPHNTLSIEHNTACQGAEACNTLDNVVDVVSRLRALGHSNVGLNLDTKCLLNEFGTDARLSRIYDEYNLSRYVTSIQVSYDFLARETKHSFEDQLFLLSRSSLLPIPPSLEEFGLRDCHLEEYIERWLNLCRVSVATDSSAGAR